MRSNPLGMVDPTGLMADPADELRSPGYEDEGEKESVEPKEDNKPSEKTDTFDEEAIAKAFIEGVFGGLVDQAKGIVTTDPRTIIESVSRILSDPPAALKGGLEAASAAVDAYLNADLATQAEMLGRLVPTIAEAMATAGLKAGINNAGQSAAASKGATDLSRPYIRKNTREAVKAAAPRTAEGKFIDPNTRLPIEGKYDLGHKAGNEFWREKAKAQSEGLTQKQFNDRLNNPKLYQIEDPVSNRSHLYEMPK